MSSTFLVEVRLRWGDALLAVRHRRASSRSIVKVGDLDLPIALSAEQRARAVVRDGALVLPSGDAVSSGRTLAITYGPARLDLRVLADDVAPIPRPRGDRRMLKGVVLGAVIHASLLACAFLGRGGVGDEDAASQALLAKYMASIDDHASSSSLPEASEPIPVPTTTPPAHSTSRGPESSNPKRGEAGAAGNVARETGEGVAMRARTAEPQGRSRNADSSPPKVDTFGMLGVLSGDASGKAPTRSAFADFEGPAAMGSIFGSKIDDAAGLGGLALSGVGEGGGGSGEGVPLDRVGTVGTGHGFGRSCDGCTTSERPHSYRLATINDAYAMVNGRLPPESIQRVVRQNFGRLRACYMKGLDKDPSLQGRVAVKFVIDRSGAVATAMVSESTIADESVNACVARAYMNMTFAQPEGGIVTVVYPVVFEKE